MVSPFLSLAGGAAQGVNNLYDAEDKYNEKMDAINAAKITAMAPALNKQYDAKVKAAQTVIAKKKAMENLRTVDGQPIPENIIDQWAQDPEFKTTPENLRKVAATAKVTPGDPNNPYKSTLYDDLAKGVQGAKAQTDAMLARGAARNPPSNFASAGINSMMGRDDPSSAAQPTQAPQVRPAPFLQRPQGPVQQDVNAQPPPPTLGQSTQQTAQTSADGTAMPVNADMSNTQPPRASPSSAIPPTRGQLGSVQFPKPPPELPPGQTWSTFLTHPDMAIRIPDAATAKGMAAAYGADPEQLKVLDTLPWGQKAAELFAAQKKAGATRIDTSTKIDMSDTESALKDLNAQASKHYASTQDLAISSQKVIDSMDQYEQLAAGIQTGKLTTMKLGAINLAQSLNVDVNKDLTSYAAKLEAMRTITNKMGLELRQNMPGSLSDADRNFLVSMPPSMNNTVAGNRMLIDYYRRTSQRAIDSARDMNRYIYGTDANPTPKTEISTKLRMAQEHQLEWSKQHPLFSEADKARAARFNEWSDKMQLAGTNTEGQTMFHLKGDTSGKQYTLPKDME